MITLEDVNSVNSEYVNDIYILDTANICTEEFTGVLYDFLVCSHRISNGEHTFTFKVQNSLWCGKVWINDDDSFDSTDNEITVVTNMSSIKIALLLSNYIDFEYENVSGSNVYGMCAPVPSVLSIPKNGFNKNHVIYYNYCNNGNIRNGRTATDEEVSTMRMYPNIITQEGVFTFVERWAGEDAGDVLVLLEKTDLVFNLNSTLTVGKVNHVLLGINSHYLPTGDLVDGAELDIVVNYNDILITAEYDSTVGDYCFDLDLTDKLDDSNVNLTVIVNESNYVNPSTHDVRLSCEYPTVSSFSELTSSIVAGAEAIRLTGDITFNSDLVLSNPLYLICDGYELRLSGNSIMVNGSCRVDDAVITGGSPCFIQGSNSKLVLNNCRFNNAIITDEYKGSVISTLPVENIITELNDCIILNCHHSIWHNGTLTVDKTRALYDNYNTSVDTDYSAFLTMTDGECEIRNSVFDIDYSDLCTDEIDIKFAESLISISPDALLNNVIGSRLASNNGLNYIFNTNQSHVYVKYYYPDIEACVITSPLIDYEDKSCCHHIIGTDKIFKDNSQITRADAYTENTTRKISWEDI